METKTIVLIGLWFEYSHPGSLWYLCEGGERSYIQQIYSSLFALTRRQQNVHRSRVAMTDQTPFMFVSLPIV